MRDDPRYVVFAKIVNRRPLKDSLAKKLYLGKHANLIAIDLFTTY